MRFCISRIEVRKIIIKLLIILVILMFSSCTINETREHDVQTYISTHDCTSYVSEPITTKTDEYDASHNFTSEQIFIQDLYKPKYVTVFPQGIFNVFFNEDEIFNYNEMFSTLKIFPFGEIVIQDSDKRTSFVIYISETFSVYQQKNLLRITPINNYDLDSIPVFMEITQYTNITVEDMEYQILSSIDIANFPFKRHLQPRNDFPFVEIQLIDGGGWDSTVIHKYIIDNSNGGVFVITTQHSNRNWEYTFNFRNALKTFEILNEPKSLSYENYNNDLFSQKLSIIFIEGTPNLVRHNPFVIINENNVEGLANYLIYIEDIYEVEQKENLLRVMSPWNSNPNSTDVFMEIKQIPHTTISEMEYVIKTSFVFDQFNIIRGQAPNTFSFITLRHYDDEGFIRDDVIVDIYIKENGIGGVFVVIMQYCMESLTGHGVRFFNSILTMTTLDERFCSPSEISIFNPLSPDGWNVIEDVLQLERHGDFIFNEGKNIIHHIDTYIGGVNLDMTLDEVFIQLTNAKNVLEEGFIGNTDIVRKVIAFDGITLTFWNIGYNDEFIVLSICVDSSKHETTRGLRVGDTAEKVFELYGTPVTVVDDTDPFHPNAWEYRHARGDIYIVCRITVIDGIVQRISFHGFP